MIPELLFCHLRIPEQPEICSVSGFNRVFPDSEAKSDLIEKSAFLAVTANGARLPSHEYFLFSQNKQVMGMLLIT